MNESSCMFEVINKTVKNGNNHNLLQREFESYGPRMVLLTDITYLRRLRNARPRINTEFFLLQNKTTPH